MILLVTGYKYKFSKHIVSFLIIIRSANPVFQLRYDPNKSLSLPTDNVINYRVGTHCKNIA